MLIGMNKPAPANATSKDADIFDVGTADFETHVIKASMTTPVLVDFWAPWCGPCKQLMPALESAVKAANGKVKMAKVNIDQNPELAQALRVQSVPTVFAFFKGQPITAFAGARPASEIKTLIDQLSKMASNDENGAAAIEDVPMVLEQAAQALTQNDAATAYELYAAILEQEPENPQAYIGLIRAFIAAGRIDEAQQYLDHAIPALKNSPLFESAKNALELARASPAGNTSELMARIGKNPDDHAARYDLANTMFAAGQKEDAINHLLEIVQRNRKWEEEKARTQLLKFFDAMGPTDPITSAGRRKLSRILFS